MMKDTKIEWCDHTFNPWIGCQKVSPACDHCYAERSPPARVLRARGIETWGMDAIPRRAGAEGWKEPLRWNRQAETEGTRPRVFCASLADVFDNRVPARWRIDLFELIRATPNLDWLLLTKRIGNAAAMLPSDWGEGYPNVWLGATVCNQEEAERDIPKLLVTPAGTRFLSIEPMLGAINLSKLPWGSLYGYAQTGNFWQYGCDSCREWRGYDVELEIGDENEEELVCPKCGQSDSIIEQFDDNPRIDWVIVGGESGPKARPMHLNWARSIRDQCQAAGVPFFFKQWGEWIPYEHDTRPPFLFSQHGHLYDAHGLPDFESSDFEQDNEEGWMKDFQDMSLARKIGKKSAGRCLDGREWNEFP